jgi:hypothetical protein
MKNNVLKRYRWVLVVGSVMVIIAITMLWTMGVIPRLFKTGTKGIELSIEPGLPGSASWAGNYQDFQELCNLSDLVVMGAADRYVELKPSHWSSRKELEFYDITTAFKVDTTIKGPEFREINLTHTIRKVPEGWVEFMAEDPPVRLGERWIFFLRWIEEAGQYSELGPWGRYKIVDDRVYSMNRVLKDDNAYNDGYLDFNGISVSEFLMQVNETLNSPVMVLAQRGLPFRGYRNHAGVYQDVDITFWAGAGVSGNVTFKVTMIDSKGLTVNDALIFTIIPAEYVVVPFSQYNSTMRFGTEVNLKPGIYDVHVGYSVDKYTDSQIFRLWIEPLPDDLTGISIEGDISHSELNSR